MNRTASEDVEASILSPRTSHGVSRISIGSSANAIGDSTRTTSSTGGNANNTNSGTLMNGNGELIIRRSPVQANASQLLLNHQSYYTLGSPSITTSYNSEEISDTVNSSLQTYDDDSNESLYVKLDRLQRQIESLTESQASHDERYKRTRQENDDLLSRVHLLEDQLRELEIAAEARSREEEKRFKETMAKQMKLKSEECEQHLNTNYQLQQDIITLQKDLIKSDSMIRTLKSEKEALESELNEKNNELSSMDEEVHKLKLLVKHLKDEESVRTNLIDILNEELEDSQQNRSQSEYVNTSTLSGHNHPQPQASSPKQKSTSPRRSSLTNGRNDTSASGVINSNALRDIDVLEANLAKFRADNQRLKELNEELQAELLNVQLNEGRSLIQDGNKSYSLADEMGDIDVQKLMKALKDEQEDNARLRRYIDDILLKIVENNPEILEKTGPSGDNNNKVKA